RSHQPYAYTLEEPVIPEGLSLPLPMNQRLKLPRQPVPHQAPEDRVHNFAEVVASFNPALAVAEAFRCIECKDAPCIQGCPVGIDIKAFIQRARPGVWRSLSDHPLGQPASRE